MVASQLIYAEDMLKLNDFQREVDPQTKGPKVFTVALPPGEAVLLFPLFTAIALSGHIAVFSLSLGVKEIGRMEDNRQVIFDNVRYGFAAAYDLLVLDPSQRVSVCWNGLLVRDFVVTIMR